MFASPDLRRGVWPERLLPGIVGMVFDVLFRHGTSYFFGQLENDVPEHLQRHAWTVAQLAAFETAAPDALTAAAAEVAALNKKGDHVGAAAATMQYVLRFFKPDYVVTRQDVEDVHLIVRMAPPGLLWLSPLHSMWLRAAKDRLHTALGGIEFLHHAVAASAIYDSAIKPALTDKGLARIREGAAAAGAAAGGSSAGYSVLRLFDKTIPTNVFRFVTRETTLDGVAPTTLPAGSIVTWTLNNATTREHRFLTCCGQKLVVAFAEAIVRAYDPTLPIAAAAVGGAAVAYPSA